MRRPAGQPPATPGTDPTGTDAADLSRAAAEVAGAGAATAGGFPRQSARTRGFTLGRPRSFTVAADGRVVLLQSRAGNDPVLRLWVLDADADTPRLVVDPLTLDGTAHPDKDRRGEEAAGAAAAEGVPAAERARRERAREQAVGIVTYATDAAVRRAVFTLNGRLYAAELTPPAAAGVWALPAAAAAHDPRLDPTGTRVAYVAAGGLHVTDVHAASPRPSAPSSPGAGHGGADAPEGSGVGYRVLAAQPGQPAVSWGVAEFIAAEEMGRHRGFWWSPDGTRLVATRVDEREVPRWYLADPAIPGQAPAERAYPAAGTVNAQVRLFVLDLAGGRVEVVWDRAALPYLVNVRWDAHTPLLLVVQSRDQQTVQILTADAGTGQTTVAHTQTDAAWVTLPSGTPRFVPPATAGGPPRLLTTTDDPATDPANDPPTDAPADAPAADHAGCDGEGDGEVQGHGQGPDGAAQADLEGDGNRRADVEGVQSPAGTPTAGAPPNTGEPAEEGWGTRRLALDGVPVTPPGLQVRRVLAVTAHEVVLTGSRQATQLHLWRVRLADGQLTQLTRTPGVHDGAVAGGTLVVTSTSLTAPPTTRIRRPGGRELALPSLAETPLVRPRPRLLRTTARQLHTALLLPRDGRADQPGARLPVLLDPYGGPGAQRVLHTHLGFATAQWFADQGFAVVVTDGRGTPGRGPAWERTVHHDLAGPVLADQVDALHDVAARHPALDLGRVAVRGWSFGGYLAALAVLRRPDVFHAAVAGAPVTDWRLYDTHYTERYLGHPDQHPDSYARSSLLGEAAGLRRPLLLVHGLADDNVVAAHTLQLSAALLAAGRPHTVLPLSGVTHMTPQEVVAENLLRLQLAFLRSALHLDPSPPDPAAALPEGSEELTGGTAPVAGTWPAGG